MASSLLDLDDLIEFQLERLKFEDLNYKDELQLQRQLLDLDLLQCSQRRLKQQHAMPKTLTNQQHQALQVPETSSCVDLPSSLTAAGGPPPEATIAASSTGAIARTSSRKSKASVAVGGSVQNITVNNGSIEIAMEDLGPGACGGSAGNGADNERQQSTQMNNSLPNFSDSEEEGFNLDQQKEFR